MDDVMADTTGQMISFYEKEFGVKVERHTLNGKGEGLGFPDNHAIIQGFPHRENFFRKMISHENCREVMEALNKKYELYIVSAAMQFPVSLSEKLAWLNEHFSFIHWKQIVFCGNKSIVHGDYMIDDHPFNLDGFNGEKFLFTAPHNTHITKFERLNNWNEVKERFL